MFSFSTKKYRHEVAICCIVKDENAYLPEWLQYHRKIGVSHFYMYDNDSTVPVSQVLSQWVAEGTVTVIPFSGKSQQRVAYQQCLHQYGAECNWLAFIDADEFIVPKTNQWSLPRLLQAYCRYGGLAVCWLIFGSGNHLHRQNSQLYSYTKRALKSHPQNRHMKSIVQPRFVKNKKPPVDPHHFWYKGGKYCVDENFRRVDGPLIEHTSDTIQLNHYNLRSLEEFQEKLQRGNAENHLGLRRAEYFDEIDKDANRITDETVIEILLLLEDKSKSHC